MSQRFYLALFILLAALAYALLKMRSPLKGYAPAPLGRRPERRTQPKTTETGHKDSELANLLLSIPKGRVVTFSTLAALLGPGASPAQLSRKLHLLAARGEIPWWRVVRREGQRGLVSSSKSGQIQRELLEKEGVLFQKRSFHLEDYQWKS